MQPTCRQVPPRYGSFSTTIVFSPSSPARIAATYPPGPLPIIATSYFATLDLPSEPPLSPPARRVRVAANHQSSNAEQRMQLDAPPNRRGKYPESRQILRKGIVAARHRRSQLTLPSPLR